VIAQITFDLVVVQKRVIDIEQKQAFGRSFHWNASICAIARKHVGLHGPALLAWNRSKSLFADMDWFL
jgi:hypothetical protein